MNLRSLGTLAAEFAVVAAFIVVLVWLVANEPPRPSSHDSESSPQLFFFINPDGTPSFIPLP